MINKTCTVCGVVYTATGPAQKYCQTCGPTIDKITHRIGVDRYRVRNGVQVGVGSGHAQGSGKKHHTYKNGIGAFREDKLTSMSSYICERCGKDLNGVVHSEHYLWCVHHKDGDRKHNEPSNWQLLCKSCHQAVHDAAGHLNQRG
jgi:hypothetical protein